ncbi:FeoA family protein [Desulfosporosinus meridiei]|uniref:Fe2+ transport system protein A n=1 Tax=Desulfosporosinus meridiei (strain ATCC BAA-275 / DSM 13257 / KCTC 12902 / NCIMB 13706 / S10) TaxID=768704 RepID=J7IRA6_DESMD|nr:FeoA family protein [Desulfosporosinus meridiei]AFQ42714.1 Fe2+ transport system protein A [Desulfosporosinus meridiei DSM 13257]
MDRTLKELRTGEKGLIVKVLGEKGSVKKRLMDMGVTRGAEVLVRKVAPLGDPIEVNIRGYELTLRKAEVQNIILESGLLLHKEE